MKKKKLCLRNYIVRGITYTFIYGSVLSFYGWFGAEIIYRICK